MSGHDERSTFLVYSLGIFVAYFIYGIIQEKITRGTYGDEDEDGTGGERFTFALALVFVQCVCNWLFAKGIYYKHIIIISILSFHQIRYLSMIT